MEVREILKHLNLAQFQTSTLSGGSIHQVYHLRHQEESLVLKCSHASQGNPMLLAEADGLKAIAATQAIRVPAVLNQGELNGSAYLLMEYIPSTRHLDGGFGKKFGQALAALHRTTAEAFGYHSSNFIGNLPQENPWKDSWSGFYINHRLRPQWASAVESGHFGRNHQKLFEDFLISLPDRLPDEPPSLVHGDLWNGNYLACTSGDPVLIDPAVYYGHREVDIAMSLLFGGFPESFYHGYHESWPLLDGWRHRVNVYQLYYLLVHVNLFGMGYVSSCLEILQKH